MTPTTLALDGSNKVLVGGSSTLSDDVEDVVARNRARRIEDRPGCLGLVLRLLVKGLPAVRTPFNVTGDSSIAPIFRSATACALSPIARRLSGWLQKASSRS